MTKRILFFAHHIQAATNPNGYRIQQYFPYLEKAGFDVGHLTTKAGIPVLIRALRRADVVYVQRLLPDLVKRYLLKRFGKKIVFDFDDAIMYGTRKESPTRRRRFGSMVRLSDAVFCGNAFLISEAKKYKRERVFYVPTVVNTADYPVKDHSSAGPSVVGWIGGASTLRYLSDIAPLFASPPRNTIFKIVADKPPAVMGAQTVFEKWSGEKEKETAPQLRHGHHARQGGYLVARQVRVETDTVLRVGSPLHLAPFRGFTRNHRRGRKRVPEAADR